jgi:hypothetical protein
MSLFTDSISDDLKQIESDSNNPTFTWNGSDFVCIPDDYLNSTIKNVQVGYDENAEFSLKARTDQFNGALPQLNDYITYAGKQLLINTIKTPVHGKYIVLICNVPQLAYRK